MAVAREGVDGSSCLEMERRHPYQDDLDDRGGRRQVGREVVACSFLLGRRCRDVSLDDGRELVMERCARVQEGVRMRRTDDGVEGGKRCQDAT